MMRKLGSSIIFLGLLVAISTAADIAGTAPKSIRDGPTLITLSEARILIYVMPDSVAIRKKRRDVVWEMVTSSTLDQSDYYFFWVSFTGPTAASRLVGYYAVNKHTADVLNIMPTAHLIAAKQLGGVQAILRKEHLIGPEIISRYRYINPEEGGSRLTPEELRGGSF